VNVSGVELQSSTDEDSLSGSIDGFRLWFRVSPGGHTARAAEPFLCAALLPAMARGEALELDPELTASPRLLGAMGSLQDIFSTWNRTLRRVPVTAREGPPPPARAGVASYFSGGVDSLHTFAERQQEITHLVQLHGFDYRRQNRSLAEEAERENRRFAAACGRELVVVESNFRELYEEHQIHTNLYHGAVLGAIALVLGFSRTYVPASFTWSQLVPWGSHPLTDPLWSTESVEIAHHGNEARRFDKLRRIAEMPEALALLRVCPTNTVYSCGLCEKCLRTRVALRVLRRTSPRLAPLEDLRPVRRLEIRSWPHRLAWQECLELAVGAGDRPLAKAIAASLARYDARRAFSSFDRAHLGGWVRRVVDRLKGLARGRDEEPYPMAPEHPDVPRI